MERELPEGIPDAQPAGGWVGEDAADETADEAQQAAWGETALADAETTEDDRPSAEDDSARNAPAVDGDPASDPFVESAEIQQGLDPDVLTDEQAGR